CGSFPIYLPDATTSQGDRSCVVLLINDQRHSPTLAVVSVQRVSLSAAIWRGDAQLGRVKVYTIPILHDSKTIPTSQPLLCKCALGRKDNVRKPNANQEPESPKHCYDHANNQ